MTKRGNRYGRGKTQATLLTLVATETDHCLEWPHGMVSTTKRYGLTSWDGKQRRAHVVACELAHGPRPSAQHEVAHSCDNPPCVNPRHLRWATRLENVKDCQERNRWPDRRCAIGCACKRHSHPGPARKVSA